MAKQEKKQSDKKPEKEIQATSATAKAPEKDAKTVAAPEQKKAEKIKPPTQAAPRKEPLVSFERWFKARSPEKGYKPHWIAGMQAFTDTSTRRSMSDWDSIFKNY